MHVYNTCTCVYSCIYWRSEHIHVRTCMHMICMYEHMIKIYCRMQLTDRSSRPELSYQLEVCDILYTSLYIARALYAAHGVCMVHVHVRIFYASIHIHVHMYVGLYVFIRRVYTCTCMYSTYNTIQVSTLQRVWDVWIFSCLMSLTLAPGLPRLTSFS